MRPAGYRTSKYSAKLVGDVIKNRIDAQRDSMVEQVTNKFADIEAAETATKALLEGWGVGTIVIPFYLSFARQCYSITQKHSGAVAVQEICIRANAWETRGLNIYYMQVIALNIFSVTINTCT